MRPKDERGIPLPPPHDRLPEACELRQAGFLALAKDSRSAIWTTKRKVTVLNKAIDHVVDGDRVPAWIFKKDDWRPENRCLFDLWTAAVFAIRAAYKPQIEGRSA